MLRGENHLPDTVVGEEGSGAGRCLLASCHRETHVWMVFKFLPLLQGPRVELGRPSPGFSQEGCGPIASVWLVVASRGTLQLLEREWGKLVEVVLPAQPRGHGGNQARATGKWASAWHTPHGATLAEQTTLRAPSPGIAPGSGQQEPESPLLDQVSRPSGKGVGEE